MFFMEHLLTQFQANLQAIQDDLIEKFPMMNGSMAAMEGLKLDYWNDMSGDVSFMVNDIQAQLDAQVPMAVEAMEIETALRESMARSVDSAFEVLSDAVDRSPKTCFNLASLYKAAQKSNTQLQSRLDDFYTSCKGRRTQHQHSLLEDMDRSLSKARERAVNRCTKHMEVTALNSKSRIRRLALRQQPQVPDDIQAVMNGVMEELQSFLDEASARSRVPPSAAPSSSKAAAGLEKALTHFFMDVSSGKTPSSLSAGGSEPIRDEFSTLTEPDAAEIQEAYYSCQYPIVDFPPDLVSDVIDHEASPPPPSPGGDEPPPPPSPPSSSSSGDSMLGDFEVIEELDNLPPGKGSGDAAADEQLLEAMETEEPSPPSPPPPPSSSVSFFEEAGPPDEGGGANEPEETPPEKKEEEEKEEKEEEKEKEKEENGEQIFIDLCDDDGHQSDVEYLFEDRRSPPPPKIEMWEAEEMEREEKLEVVEDDDDNDGDRHGSHGRNIFEVLQRSSPSRWSQQQQRMERQTSADQQPSKSAASILMQTSAEAFYADPAMVREVEAAVQSIIGGQPEPADSAPTSPSSARTVLSPLEAAAPSPAPSSESTVPGILAPSCDRSGAHSPDREAAGKEAEGESLPPDFSKNLSNLASQLMALRNSDGSFSTPDVPTGQMAGLTSSTASESDALKLQLVHVLDRMVELCEAPGGVEIGDDAKSRQSIPARLDMMLRESFNLVASNRAGGHAGGGDGAVGWQLSIDKTCADFQSQMSAALSSFLMSPASECGPIPSVAASDRVAAWDLPLSNEPPSCVPDALSGQLDELEPASPAAVESAEMEPCGLQCRPPGPQFDASEEQSANNPSPVSAMPAPATPEFPRNDGDETASAPEAPPSERQSVAFDNFSSGQQNASCTEPTNSHSSNERCAVNYEDSDKINDDDILEALFTSKPAEANSEGTAENADNAVENSSIFKNREASQWTGCYVYFFRSEESEEAKRAEWLLLRAGACLFDPYHPHLLNACSRLAVLIHAKDASHSHHVPNLLQLKNMRDVAFKVYEDSLSCSLDQCREIFPPGSTCLVLDRDTLTTTHPDNLVSLITFVREECQMNRPCRIVLHRQLYKYLSDISARCENRGELYRLERLRELLTNPKQDGLIQWAGEAGPEVDNLQFMLDIQKRFQHVCRDFFLLTNIDANDLKSHIFARGGISVMNINQYIINYTTKAYNGYSCASAANPCLSDLSEDAPLSWCIDILPSVGCSAV